MRAENNISLLKLNSFAVDASTHRIYFPECEQDLIELCENLPSSFYILGEGSNTLFIDETAPVIICPQFKGIDVEEFDDCFILDVAAGENWHELVSYCAQRNMPGIENLALIPGSVGAAPVQNIGAYGVEFSNVCESVTWFDFNTKASTVIANQDCHFSYRNSIFKNKLKGLGVITHVKLRLLKNSKPTLSYDGLAELTEKSSCMEIMQRVIEIRQQKLPDPKELPNAGSFFKNPVVSIEKFDTLTKRFGKMPNYKVDNTQVKLAAGWLIEHAGLKGYQQNGVGVHNKQALVIVNTGRQSGKIILQLSQLVQREVFNMFGIELEPEVRFVGANGEVSPKQVSQHG